MAAETVHPNEEMLLQAVQELAGALGETTRKPRRAIWRIIRAKGVDFARRHLEEAQQVHAMGGMQRWDGQGTRTLGGVWFALVRQTMGHWEFYRVAYTWQQNQKRLAAVKRAIEAKEARSASGYDKLASRGTTQRTEGERPAVGGSTGAGAEPQV